MMSPTGREALPHLPPLTPRDAPYEKRGTINVISEGFASGGYSLPGSVLGHGDFGERLDKGGIPLIRFAGRTTYPLGAISLLVVMGEGCKTLKT